MCNDAILNRRKNRAGSWNINNSRNVFNMFMNSAASQFNCLGSYLVLYRRNKLYSRAVGWWWGGGGGGGGAGSRGSNEPPKIFEVGIFGGLKRSKKFTQNNQRL